jgi:excisionase family DNA binding protein
MKRKRGTDEVPRRTEWRKVMTMDEVAEYLRVHRTTIYRLIKRHKIPAFRVGRNWRFNMKTSTAGYSRRRAAERASDRASHRPDSSRYPLRRASTAAALPCSLT